MTNRITFQDLARVDDLNLCKDAQSFVADLIKEGRKITLGVDVKATYSGYLLNGRVYPGQHMAKATPTWVDQVHGGVAPYNAPVLRHHDKVGEPIGRVVSAQYEKLWAGENWQDDWKHPVSNFDKGSGYIKLGLEITDMDAIQKFMDKRYLTFSTSFNGDQLLCSICGHNIISDKKICHESGKTYDNPHNEGEKLQCYYIAPPASYSEVSVVNHPAQPHAIAEVLKVIADSVADTTLTHVYSSSFDIPSRGVLLMVKDEATGDATPLTLIEGKQDAIPSGSGFVRPSTKVVIPSVDLTQSPKGTSTTGVTNSDAVDAMSDSDFAFARVAKHLYEIGMLATDSEMATMKAEDVMVPAGITLPSFEECFDKIIAFDEAIADSKLSTAQREKLKSSTFCGPNRSFPVPDCAHVTAARRLIGRHKGSAEEKKRILSCVSRHSSKLGCGSSSDTGQQIQENQNMSEPTAAAAGATTGKPDEAKGLAALAEQLADSRALNKQLQADRDSKDAELLKITGELTGLKDVLHKERCLRLSVIRAVTVKTVDGKALDSVAAVEEYAKTLGSRTGASIEDALKDDTNVFNQKLPHLKSLPNFVTEVVKPDAATLTRVVTEVVKENKDNKDKLDI